MSKGFIHSDQMVISGHREVIGFGDESFAVKEIEREVANRVIRANHYSGVVYSGSWIHLGVFTPVMRGVLQFGAAMNPASFASVVAGTGPDEYLELNRMWLNDSLPRNSESMAISYALKFIKRKYPKIAWVQSFADERCGRYGVVYQAANFTYCGEHTSSFWEIDGTYYHNSLMTRDPSLTPKAAFVHQHKDTATEHKLRQFRYIYFLNPKYKAGLMKKEQPYPKHEGIANANRD